ncbi:MULTISPECIES: replication protein [unclassified Acinetobacter]|uniref:replication protein n=1 Tax=unclassified Acinetobacter TaxID=196816 RepID=UPI0015D2FC65|nr:MULTISPECIES: replication protein [unclassified Acinetobacter]
MSSFVPNSFQLPNALIDDGVMAEMKGAALAIYILIVRKTRGWQKETDAISISQFMKFTGYGKDAVISGAEKLVSLGLVEKIARDHQATLYSLSDLAEREISNLSENPTTANLSENTTGVVGKTDINLSENPTHNNNSKTTNTKTNISKEKSKKTSSEKPAAFDAKSVELPVNVNRELWIGFVDMRNSIRKPLTEKAVGLMITKLIGFGELANQSLENSIMCNYQGVFLPKTQPAVNQDQPQTQRRRFGNQASETQMRTVVGVQTQ